MSCEYIRQTYGVPAEIGRLVVVDGKPGIIAKDCGNYLGVNFDADKPGVVKNCHPTWNVVYGEMGKARAVKMTRGQSRYQEYLDSVYYEAGHSFAFFLGIPGVRV